MSNSDMKWSDKSLLEWNLFIHEKVMNKNIHCLGKPTLITSGYMRKWLCFECAQSWYLDDIKDALTFRHLVSEYDVPAYTKNMNDALLIADYDAFHGWMLSASKPWTSINGVSRRGDVNDYECTLYLSNVTSNLVASAEFKSAPVAICQAALKACGCEIEREEEKAV